MSDEDLSEMESPLDSLQILKEEGRLWKEEFNPTLISDQKGKKQKEPTYLKSHGVPNILLGWYK